MISQDQEAELLRWLEDDNVQSAIIDLLYREASLHIRGYTYKEDDSIVTRLWYEESEESE